ncbi:MAG: single-stranded DNA-binding protein [Streptosporangiaceae bacterium]
MANDAFFAVTGYVATQPKVGKLKDGTCTLSMRVAWTPRVINKATGEWADQQTSFVSVTCYRKVAENAAVCLRRGDPITLRGTLRVREYADQAGVQRNSVDVVADSLGHDMSRGTSHYTKAPRHAEQTAQEYESSTAAERNPLPGDVAVAGRASEEPSDGPRRSEAVQLTPADDSYDEPDPAELTSGQPDADLVGARA